MQQVHVFTSAACNYVPKIRALVESIRQHQPGWRVHVALADQMPDNRGLLEEGVDEVHPLSELEIPNWRAWAFCHEIVELATAIKPFVLKRLLARQDCKGVVYLDPDIVLFSPIHEVEHSLESAAIALTPHVVDPETSIEAVIDNEIASALQHGVYNLGFLAVSATDEGARFAQWWADRVYHFCRADIPHGLFTDQRWIDLVPALFEGVKVVRSRRLNVATWNLTTRKVTGAIDEGLYVNGERLGFYHFTGFDSGAHSAMAWKNARDQPAVNSLIRWYQGRMRESEFDPLTSRPWAFGTFDDGTPIPRAARIVYRERIDLQAAFPDPFSASEGGFRQWWEHQGKFEYPGLFGAGEDDAAFAALKRQLTAGFRGHGEIRPGRSIQQKMERAMHDDSYRKEVIARLKELLAAGDFRGVLRRIRGR